MGIIMKVLGKLLSLAGWLSYAGIFAVAFLSGNNPSMMIIIVLAVMGTVLITAGFLMSFRARAQETMRSIASNDPPKIPKYTKGLLNVLGMGEVNNMIDESLGMVQGQQLTDLNSVLAPGTILSVNVAGAFVKQAGRQPMQQADITVQFVTTFGQQITVSGRKLVELSNLGQLQPGNTVNIRYNPQNPQEFLIA
jgi:hypothetical protein